LAACLNGFLTVAVLIPHLAPLRFGDYLTRDRDGQGAPSLPVASILVGMSSPKRRASRASSFMSASAALIGSDAAWFQSSSRSLQARALRFARLVGLFLGDPHQRQVVFSRKKIL